MRAGELSDESFPPLLVVPIASRRPLTRSIASIGPAPPDTYGTFVYVRLDKADEA